MMLKLSRLRARLASAILTERTEGDRLMSYADVSRRVDISRRLSKCLLIVCLTIAALSARLPEASASTITAVPSSSNVLVNELFAVDFVLDDFTDLFLFQMGVSYDASLLSLVGVTAEGSHLASGGGTSFISGDTSTPGTISFIANSLSGTSGVTGGGTLFTVQFQAIGPGIANIFAVFDPDPLVGDGLYNSNSAFELTTPSVQGGQVSISAPPTSVPEPATILSLGFGVGVLAVARRREQRRRLPQR
jgi:hypothetical protein